MSGEMSGEGGGVTFGDDGGAMSGDDADATSDDRADTNATSDDRADANATSDDTAAHHSDDAMVTVSRISNAPSGTHGQAAVVVLRMGEMVMATGECVINADGSCVWDDETFSLPLHLVHENPLLIRVVCAAAPSDTPSVSELGFGLLDLLSLPDDTTPTTFTFAFESDLHITMTVHG